MSTGKCRICGETKPLILDGICKRCASKSYQEQAERENEYIDDGEPTGLDSSDEELEERLRPIREQFISKWGLQMISDYRKAHGKKY